MNIGKLIRMKRIFSHPTGRFCSIAVDHFIGYSEGLPMGLKNIKSTLSAIVSARPDAVTMHKGIAASTWAEHAGIVPLIVQSTIARVDDSACEQVAMPEDAIRLGADGFAVAAFVKGRTEAEHLREVANCVREAIRFDIPVICHIYPRKFDDTPRVSFDPDDIAWAVRCAVEVGADIVKVPYCGDVTSYTQIVEECPIPLVAAGGPRTSDFISALTMMSEVVRSGARGATIGRNVWGFRQITAAVLAFKSVIHDMKKPEEAIAGVHFSEFNV